MTLALSGRVLAALFLASSLSFAASAATKAPFPAEGVWRGEFTIDGDPIPFNFEVKGTRAQDATFTLLNGTRTDRFKVTPREDGIFSVRMNTYDAVLEGKLSEDGKHLVGHYKDLVPSRNGARNLAFTAEQGAAWRFVKPGQDEAPAADLSGKWAVQTIDKAARQDKRNQVALLKQEGNRLSGVFMTVVGDTRELEGTVQGNRFYLSGFSGPSPLLIRGTIDEDGNIQGAFGSGIYNVVKFEAEKNDKVELPDPYKLTFLKDGQERIDFSFPDLQGKQVSLQDDKYRGKVVIVEVIGTWCPNCTDQTYFLAPWFKQNQHRGVEAVAVAFEQEDNFDYFKKTLTTFKDYFDIRYDIVFGGIADKKVATEKLKGLNYMAAFPTTIIIGRDGKVREIYTGYTGTVTGEYHQDYVARFNSLLDGLIAEPDPYAASASTASTTPGLAIAP